MNFHSSVGSIGSRPQVFPFLLSTAVPLTVCHPWYRMLVFGLLIYFPARTEKRPDQRALARQPLRNRAC
jgi:hypothetical protein